ncbi:MAG: SusC/RagA family TonB-linked outer membrane protein [Gemmatimonadaceae bacterium]|nr:SusC/RagA family TonB-linked outer membrane protein [Gemmatimonadaceae bacterium]
MGRTRFRRTAWPTRVACGAVALLAVLVVAPPVSAQTAAGTIVGQVTEARSNRPLAGVTIQVNGTRLGAVTTEEGRYRIVGAPVGTQVLSVRRLGYASAQQSVSVGSTGTTTANLQLQPQATSLDEVVVTGTAGGEVRRSIGNAVTTISAPEATQKSASQDLSSLIGARAPGVAIAPATGRLGAAPTIQIRGRSSIGLDNSPLLYIDGVRVNNASAAGPVAPAGRLGGQASNVSGRLNDVNPEDIESIEIIKGPAAATIYGTEAANGVIQIITKKGATSGAPAVKLQVQDGIIWFRDAANRVPTNYARNATTGEIIAWNGVQSEADRGTPIFTTGQTRQYTGSVSGGRDVVRYYASGSFENDLGIEPNNSLRQFASHVNMTIAPSEKLDFGTSINYVNLSSHLGADVGVSALLGAVVGHSLLFSAARGFYPNFPPEVPQTLYDNAQGVNRFTGSVTMNHRPLSWFSQRLVAGMDLTSDDSRAIERFATPDLVAFIGPVAGAGSIGQTIRRNTIASVDYAGTAKFQLTNALSSASSLGGQFFRTELNKSFLGGTGFPGLGVETVSAVSNPAQATQDQTINTTIGAYGQQQFGWRDRLFVTAALRVDNNSAFGEDFKWITYPKLSASWVVNEESFWPANSYVNSLKLRAAYGESGRQPTAFSALRTYSPAQGPGGVSAVTPNTIGNPSLKPERGKELELGFEGQVFSRLGLDFTYFSKRTQDVIISQPIAPSSGFAGNQFANLGRVDNHGFELLATLQAMARDNFSWEIVGNIATNSDVIKDLGGIGGVVLSAGQTNVVGYPIGGIFTRRIISADRDPATGLPINVLCEGAGGAGVACATAPFQYIGTPTPRTTGSVGNTVWIGKNLRLYGLVDFKRGHRAYNQNDLLRCIGAAGAPTCRSSYYPLEYDPVYLAGHGTSTAGLGTTDQFYESGNFAKLRELSATVTVPPRFVRGFSAASITVAGRDLHTWTSFTGLDPEGNLNNVATTANLGNQGLVPPLSRLLATVNLSF